MNVVKVRASNGRDAIVGETTLGGVPITLVVSGTNLERAREFTGAEATAEVLGILAYEAEVGRLPMEPLNPHGETFLWMSDGAVDLSGCKLVPGS